MTTGCCGLLFSAVHNVVSARPQQILPHSFICFNLHLVDTFCCHLLFLTPYFPLISFFSFQSFALVGLSHVTFHLRLAFCVTAFHFLAVCYILLPPSLQRCLWTTSITTMTSHQGASYDFVLITCCLTFKASHFHRDGHYIYVIRGWLCCCCWWWWWW